MALLETAKAKILIDDLELVLDVRRTGREGSWCSPTYRDRFQVVLKRRLSPLFLDVLAVLKVFGKEQLSYPAKGSDAHAGAGLGGQTTRRRRYAEV
jgi:hypothetical protein